ncbi:hypothetical protein HPO96_30260 [Kribbella sandramycini]|nr:hypothetical protein [Kribbella sandramycini]
MTYGALGEAAWSWVLGQVRWDDTGPWIPESGDGPKPEQFVTGMHSGVGGLAYTLAEIKLSRPWTASEQELAAGIADRVRRSIPVESSITFFDGLVSSIGILTALGEPGSAAAIERAWELITPAGWHETFLEDETVYAPGAVTNDLTLGTGAALLGALWALRHGIPAQPLAERAVELLLAEQEPGPNWLFVPRRYLRQASAYQMPNFSHGLAGIAAVLALAGAELDRPELVETGRQGAEHLISLGINDGKGFRVARVIPWEERHGDEFTFNWCHGGAGTSLLFSALQYAGADQVAGESPATWRERCLDAVRNSGLPERLHPGFWDNDGRCCGTAGVADAFLTAYQRDGAPQDLAFAKQLADTLVDHAHRDGSTAYWRFIEHKNEEPLLPPGVGWMQGAAGIAALLFRINRVAEQGRPAAIATHLDNWWAS